MRVLLLLPPYPKDKIFRKSMKALGATLPPLGLAYIASMLEKNGYVVKIIDGPALASGYGYSFNDLGSDIKKFNPEVVGVSGSYSQLEFVKKSLILIKKINPNIITVLGGPLITSMPDVLNNLKNADFGLYGEAEFTFMQILDKIKNHKKVKGTKGVVWREKNTVKFLQPRIITKLDELPMPAWHLLKMEIYKPSPANYRRLPATTIMTSRGCPYQCIFCSRSIEGTAFRAHSAERVADEIEYLIKEYGIKDIQVFDDTFTLNRKRTIEICNSIIERNLDIGWNCMTRADKVDMELLKLMKKAGCYQVGFGIESGSERVLKYIKKSLTKEQIITAVGNAKKAGLHVRGFFMIGFPTEKKSEIMETINFAKELDVEVAQFMVATPLPGTKMWDLAMKNGIINETEPSIFTFYAPEKMPFTSRLLSEKELTDLYKMAYRSFYLRPKFILKQVSRISNFRDMRRNFDAAKGIFGL